MSFDAPEPPHVHSRGALPPWLEWITAISALIVSVASIFIALRNGEVENRMVKATSYPYLDFGMSNATPEGVPRLSVDLINRGVGPAHEESMRIKVGDHYATSLQDLIATVVGPQDAKVATSALKAFTNTVPTRFVPANTTQFVFQMPKTEANARWWSMMNASAQTWAIDVCYCSVFDECWTRHNEETPTPVKACHRVAAQEYNN